MRPLLSLPVFVAGFASHALATPLSRRATANILISNDDGWAEANIRAFYQTLIDAGFDALVSAPAENESGTGSSSKAPEILTEEGEFNSIPVGAPAEGSNSTDDHIWYVNAFPADAVTFGLDTLAPEFFGGAPDLVVTGPNVGTNLGIATLFSGTVGAASTASLAGVPAIAFSGDTGSEVSYTTLTAGDVSFIYADAATNFTSNIIAAGVSGLPSSTILNVNFPAAGDGTDCTAGSDFSFVLSRVYSALGLPIDVETCGSSSLPTETDVVGTDGCFASVSVMNAENKLDADEADQATVLALIGDLLSCLPS